MYSTCGHKYIAYSRLHITFNEFLLGHQSYIQVGKNIKLGYETINNQELLILVQYYIEDENKELGLVLKATF